MSRMRMRKRKKSSRLRENCNNNINNPPPSASKEMDAANMSHLNIYPKLKCPTFSGKNSEKDKFAFKNLLSEFEHFRCRVEGIETALFEKLSSRLCLTDNSVSHYQ